MFRTFNLTGLVAGIHSKQSGLRRVAPRPGLELAYPACANSRRKLLLII
jgi:hypothetical protein